MNRPSSEILNWEAFLKLSKQRFAAKMVTVPASKEVPEDFTYLREVSSGAFSRVILAKISGKVYAAKVMEKSKLIATNQVKQVINEKNILFSINFPFILSAKYFLKDNCHLYIVLPFVGGGELLRYIYLNRGLTERVSKFFTAQIILALEYLHYLDIVYRDLKPENVMLDDRGYIRIIDFGFSKVITSYTYTICGTPEYLAPEIILNKGYTRSVDWWALGILIFEMCTARTPFYHAEPLKMYQHITSGKFEMAQTFSKDLKDLIRHLLQVKPSQRLGCSKSNVKKLKAHSWFSSTNWLEILNKTAKPPLTPTGSSEDRSSNKKEFHPVKASQDQFTEEFKMF